MGHIPVLFAQHAGRYFPELEPPMSTLLATHLGSDIASEPPLTISLYHNNSNS